MKPIRCALLMGLLGWSWAASGQGVVTTAERRLAWRPYVGDASTQPLLQPAAEPGQGIPTLTVGRATAPVTARPGVASTGSATRVTDRSVYRVEPFKGALLDMDRGGLPYLNSIVPLGQGVGAIEVKLLEPVFEPVPSEDLQLWPAMEGVGADVEVRHALGWYRKRPQAIVDIVPFRKDPATGRVERLVGYRLEIATKPVAVGAKNGRSTYPDVSRLASGEWFRFTVARDGVYRLSYEFLQSLGVPLPIASDQLNIYGSHFGLIPFQNSGHGPTDLLLNALSMHDGGDGTFGPGDFILFYATGPNRWRVEGERFTHVKNVYSDSASYFIGIGIDPPQRIAPAVLTAEPPTRTVNTFSDRQVLDRDVVNLVKSGRTWFGEVFDNVLTYNFSFDTPFLVQGETVTLTFNGAARTVNSGSTSNSSSFRVVSGSALDQQFNVVGVSSSYSGPMARVFNQVLTFAGTGSSIPVAITFTKHDPVSSVGWMNFLNLNCRRGLRMAGDQLAFRDLPSVGPGEIAEFVLENSPTVHRIWEITDPRDVREVVFNTVGQDRTFRVRTDSLREFIAFRDAGYLTPTAIGRVANQNLHGTAVGTDLVIVAPPEFMGQAQRIAQQRASEGLDVVMVTPQQVFNEFSSGARDASAIKRYMRMLYDRAGNDEELMPRYLLLFGDGSYNNVSLAATNQNFIPSYQTENSWDFSRSYTSDDFFGLLDPQEGEAANELVDIGIGRLTVHTVQQAREVVDKILNYDRLQLMGATGNSCNLTGDGGIPDWRTHVLFTSDDQDGSTFESTIHMSQSDFLARRVEDEHPWINVDKIFLDAYQQVSTPGGQRYPQASQDLKDRVQKGTLLVNYIGHGGEVGWAHERFLDNPTILGWSNRDRLPLFMTATCEFSRWDDPGRTSAGEFVLLNPNGGGVGLFSTTRLAYSDQNFQLGQRFYDHIFTAADSLGREFRLGDVYRETKRSITAAQPTQINHRNFSLLGDPSQRLAMPRANIRITAVTDTMGQPLDTLKALSRVRISGFVDNGAGQPMAEFNGIVIPTVYDKQLQQATLANDGGSPFLFKVRKNILYRGRATVTNGSFSFTFVVPKDINYEFGPGRVACYAEGWSTNAAGWDNEIIVGGTATDVDMDEQGPRVELFMNDERFVRGGITDESPLLFAKLFDESGINTVGNSIGHDLVATLDANTERAIVLNDLYEADLDTYQSGTVRYRFKNLEDGPHTLSLKAWDVFNNSTETTTEFVVAPSAELALAHVLNYPNPFTTYTEFFFEHNRPCTTLGVQLQVFTVSGRVVKTINRQVACEGYRSDPMAWDGRDDYGDKLARGVYVYRLSVTTPDGEKAEKFEKLVILR
jgi:hypothetical protein